MDDKDYEILLALSEEKSISKAAEKLFTHSLHFPNASRNRKRTGYQLLCRTSRGVLLTPLGEGIIPYVQTISSPKSP